MTRVLKSVCRKEQGVAEPGNTCLTTPGTCESCPNWAKQPIKKLPAKGSPTSRSLKFYRNCGCIAEKVEQRLPIPGKFVTRDLFNCFDIIAVHKELKLIIGVQSTSTPNMGARRKKILAEPMMKIWKSAGGKIHLQGWDKKGLKQEEL